MQGRTRLQYGQTYCTLGVLDTMTRNATYGHLHLTSELKFTPFGKGNRVKDLIRPGKFGVCFDKQFVCDIKLNNSLHFSQILSIFSTNYIRFSKISMAKIEISEKSKSKSKPKNRSLHLCFSGDFIPLLI